MLAPASNRNRETALTMPGRSGQETSRRLELLQDGAGDDRIGHQGTLGDLEFEARGGHAGAVTRR